MPNKVVRLLISNRISIAKKRLMVRKTKMRRKNNHLRSKPKLPLPCHYHNSRSLPLRLDLLPSQVKESRLRRLRISHSILL